MALLGFFASAIWAAVPFELPEGQVTALDDAQLRENPLSKQRLEALAVMDKALERIEAIYANQTINVPSNVTLLAHIPFYISTATRFDGTGHCSGIQRNSSLWQDIRFQALRALIVGIDGYGVRASIVVDTNDDSCEGRIREELGAGTLRNSKLRVVAHKNLTHGYLLTAVHRAHMAQEIHNFDFFLYAEDDVVLPPALFQYVYDHWRELYKHKRVPCPMRMVMDKAGDVRFSDNTDSLCISGKCAFPCVITPCSRQSKRMQKLEAAGESNGLWVQPYATYAAAWLYPQEVMRQFVKAPMFRCVACTRF